MFNKTNKFVFYGLSLIFIITLLSYSHAVGNGFIWDDNKYVLENSNLCSFEGLKRIWIEPFSNPQYYPLTFTAFWIQYRLWGDSPFGYHLINILLHIINALLLYYLLSKIRLDSALIAAFIFAVHPIYVESVAWISELKNVLSGMFYLLSLISYLKFDPLENTEEPKQKKKYFYYSCSVVFYIFALLSKTVTCTLPVAIILLIWWKKNKISLKNALFLIPYFIIGAFMGLTTVLLEKYKVGALGSEWNYTFIERFLIAGRALWFYALKIISPNKLTFFYPRWNINQNIWWQYVYPLGVIFLILLLWKNRDKAGKGVIAGVSFFIITLFPALGFFNVYPMRYSFVADHFQYLASIGLIVIFATLIKGVFSLKQLTKKHYELIFYSVIIFALSFLTFHQTKIYKNHKTLLNDVIAKNPTSFIAYSNRGVFYESENNYKLALADYNIALIYKKDFLIFYNRGNVYSNLGMYDFAFRDYGRSIKLNSYYPNSYNNRGFIYYKNKKYDLAIKDYNKAIKLHPNYITAYLNRGISYRMKKRYKLAIADFDEVLKIDPDNKDAIKYKKLIHKTLNK